MPSHSGKGALVAEITWREVADRIAAGAIGILPVGAACKEHGLHLPMNTDLIQAEWFAAQLALERNALIWPAVGYGYYPVFADYPGSCTLERDTFSNCVCEILRSVCNSGVGKIIVINTGISTIVSLQTAIARLDQQDRALLFNAYSGSCFKQVCAEIEEQAAGTHADEIETSLMLAIAPQVVDTGRLVEGLLEQQPGPLNWRDPAKPNYSPSGVIGDARFATAEKGRRLADAILADLNMALAMELAG